MGGGRKKICREGERAERAAIPFAAMKMEKVERERLAAGTVYKFLPQRLHVFLKNEATSNPQRALGNEP